MSTGSLELVKDIAPAPAQVREKKAALIEVIELQRIFIERGRNRSDQTDDAEELRWYTEQANRLEKFKGALNAMRLQPDEFTLLVPQHWATCKGTSSRELVQYVLRINARSQLTFMPTPPGTTRNAETDLLQRQTSTDDSLGGSSPRVFFMDALRQVRLNHPEAEGGCGGSESLFADASGSSSNRRCVGMPRALCIELVGESPLTCVTPEAAELVEALGAHLRRYNSSRVAQVRALKALHSLKCTAYDGTIDVHRKLLARLWACGFGSESKCQVHSERWVHLGFQSADPAKDFRGMGLLGLANLVYFGEHYPDVFRRLVAAQCKRDYPLACAGINITSLLLELLNMKDDGEPAAVHERPPFDMAWGCDMFHFFCHMFYRDRAFEDMYCFCLRLLDRMYVSMDADYADFNTVLAALRARLVDALAQRPLSFREFKRLIAAGSTDSEGSIHSSGFGPGSSTTSGNDGTDADQLASTITEAMIGMSATVDGIRTGLKGAAAALSNGLSKSLRPQQP